MATKPSKSEVKRFQLQTDKAVARKLASQAKAGKKFELPEGGGPGVIPERIWKNLPGKVEERNGSK